MALLLGYGLLTRVPEYEDLGRTYLEERNREVIQRQGLCQVQGSVEDPRHDQASAQQRGTEPAGSTLRYGWSRQSTPHTFLLDAWEQARQRSRGVLMVETRIDLNLETTYVIERSAQVIHHARECA
jgi:hypothetical protein